MVIIVGRLIGIDYGDARTGIAVSDPTGLLAVAVVTIHEKNIDILVKEIADTIEKYETDEFVVGYPKDMMGNPGPRAVKTERFAKKLQRETNIPVVLFDERYSTQTALQYLNATDTRGKKRKNILDTVSAAIILQDYMDMKKNLK